MEEEKVNNIEENGQDNIMVVSTPDTIDIPQEESPVVEEAAPEIEIPEAPEVQV